MWNKQEEIKIELVAANDGNCQFVGLPERFIFIMSQLPSQQIMKDPLLALQSALRSVNQGKTQGLYEDTDQPSNYLPSAKEASQMK